MKAVMSLWTGVPGFRLTRQSALLFSAAAAFLNRAWEQTEIVTDRRGLRIAERLGWEFCHSVCALDGFCPPHATHVFALGKLEAQALQTAPSAHFDLDVLCYQLPPRRWREAAVGYQSTDEPDGYARPERDGLLRRYGIAPAAPVNTGLLCWNDLEIRDAYIERAREIAFDAAKTCGDGLAVSLVAEQALLAALLREHGVRGEPLIPMASLTNEEDFTDCPFTHLWSTAKKSGFYLAKVEERFRREFPAQYAAATRGFALLVNQGLAVR